jgi:hypothetical protein
MANINNPITVTPTLAISIPVTKLRQTRVALPATGHC